MQCAMHNATTQKTTFFELGVYLVGFLFVLKLTDFPKYFDINSISASVCS